MKKITKVAFLFILLISLFSGCRTANKPQADSKVSSESETGMAAKEPESTNSNSDDDLPELSLTGQLSEDIAQLCELEKDRGTAVEAHDIDGESAIISFWSKESQSNFASYSYILSEKQGLTYLQEFGLAGDQEGWKFTLGGVQGYSRTEQTINVFSWQDRQRMDQEKIVGPEEILQSCNPSFWYTYTDDFKKRAVIKGNTEITEKIELVIENLEDGSKTVEMTLGEDVPIGALWNLDDIYFLNSNQLLYTGLSWEGEGKQPERVYGIMDLESQQNSSIYKRDVALYSETGCIMLVDGNQAIRMGKATDTVLLFQRENEEWISFSFPKTEKVQMGIGVSRSGKYLMVSYYDRETESSEGRVFETATGEQVATVDMNLENKGEKSVSNFCILEDQEQLVYFGADGTTEIINFGRNEK